MNDRLWGILFVVIGLGIWVMTPDMRQPTFFLIAAAVSALLGVWFLFRTFRDDELDDLAESNRRRLSAELDRRTRDD